MFAGYAFIPEAFIAVSGNFLVGGLTILMFFVGIDLGMEGTVVPNFKRVGWRVAVIPLAVIVGTLAGTYLTSLFLPISWNEAMAIGSGLGWYTFAPVLLSEYSQEIAAISFMHNVMRELFGLLLIPIVAKYIGYVEAVGLPGGAAMDVGVAVVDRVAGPNAAIYSFVAGVVLSAVVPVLVPFFINL
jgi:uncharacterized membrane protein YbjE (DUF340 family)